MATVSERPPGANDPHPHADLADPDVHAEWLAGLANHTADLIMAAVDATKPPALRMLGRQGARNLIDEAVRGLTVGFAAVGIDLADPPPAYRYALARLAKPREPTAASEPHHESEPTAASEPHHESERDYQAEIEREVATLGESALAFACAGSDDDRDNALQDMPLAGVLFLALTGSRGEHAEVDPPLLQALCALRDTVNGWIHAPRARTDRVSISVADLDLLARRVDATIEITRRGRMVGAP